LHEAYRFNTYSFTSLLWLYKLFYTHSKKKVIPANIVDYLTPLALAIWIMDDGTWKKPGVRIATNSFTKEQVKLLKLALETKFNIKTTLHKNNERYQLYIKQESISLLKKLVLPHIVPSMFYKFGL
jgi:ubiquinol-cytochrome c reductase cytochrome b subunit